MASLSLGIGVCWAPACAGVTRITNLDARLDEQFGFEVREVRRWTIDALVAAALNEACSAGWSFRE